MHAINMNIYRNMIFDIHNIKDVGEMSRGTGRELNTEIGMCLGIQKKTNRIIATKIFTQFLLHKDMGFQ